MLNIQENNAHINFKIPVRQTGGKAVIPTIGDNENWYIDGVDTGKPSRGETGPQGNPGKDGTNGKDGEPGSPGKDGLTPHIGDNGNWYLGDTDTGNPSRGPQGQKGDTGPQGKDGAGLDITSASVGQIAKISAVDDNGVPTAWEPVDMPSGGGDEWEIVGEVPLNSDTAIYYLADFAIYRKIWILMDRPSNLSISTNIVRLNFATKSEPLEKWFSAGILNNEYKYLHFDIKLEVSNLFATSRIVGFNGNDYGAQPSSRGLKLLNNISPSELTFFINFATPSMIQPGDTLTVLGVKR